MKPTPEEQPKVPKPKKRIKYPGQLHFKNFKEYNKHLEETLGQLHLETLSKGKR